MNKKEREEVVFALHHTCPTNRFPTRAEVEACDTCYWVVLEWEDYTREQAQREADEQARWYELETERFNLRRR